MNQGLDNRTLTDIVIEHIDHLFIPYKYEDKGGRIIPVNSNILPLNASMINRVPGYIKNQKEILGVTYLPFIINGYIINWRYE